MRQPGKTQEGSIEAMLLNPPNLSYAKGRLSTAWGVLLYYKYFVKISRNLVSTTVTEEEKKTDKTLKAT